MELSDAKRMKAAGGAAIGERGIDSLALMETAAGFVAEAAAEYLGDNRTAVIFCGPGNNGGDGVAAARLLAERTGAYIRAFLVGDREKMTPDTLAMERKLTETGVALEPFRADDPMAAAAAMNAGVIVDALFGVGLRRPLTGDALAAVKLMNESPAPVVAADIASGVSADSGMILGEAVRAACTVTFSKAKPGHFIEPGCVCCGELRVKDIGIPADLVRASGCGVYAIHGEDLRLPVRDRLMHKGDCGKLLILGGSVAYTGAPSLCAAGAVRSGAGLVYLGVPADIYEITAVKNQEAMPFPLSSDGETAWSVVRDRLEKCDVCVMGPGMGRSGAAELTRRVLAEAKGPLVLDADALWALSQDLTMLERTEAQVVLTPHAGEFARLLGRPVEDRLGDAVGFAREHRCAVILKGHHTICAFPDGKAFVVDAGNPGMATGGTGDVLAGVVGGMLGQLPFRRAVVTACWLHARAGDIAAARVGEYALKAGDIVEDLCRAEMEIIG